MSERTMKTPSGKPRVRSLGVRLHGNPGRHNAITDVPGIAVGYVTLIEGHGPMRVGEGPVRTGVTAILPRSRDGVGLPCAAGFYSLNGNGEMTGVSWIEETGALASPILLTNTHAVGACHRGIIDWTVRHRPHLAEQWLLPVVAETWDGYLNDINGNHVTPQHAVAAIDAAVEGAIEEGSVGGGTGMNCYAFKGGSGTASRRVSFGTESYTLGAFVQANFGARHELTIGGTYLGEMLAGDNPMEDFYAKPGAGSVIAIVATDAPLLPGQCKALARRVPLGLARTGTSGSHFSGDLFLAFSTANKGALISQFSAEPKGVADLEQLTFVQWGHMDHFYEATVQAVEEAVLNALTAAGEMIGRDGHRTPGLPRDKVVEALRR
ncbi:DmpA family aminopeptidase [Dongia sp. agr-C8]